MHTGSTERGTCIQPFSGFEEESRAAAGDSNVVTVWVVHYIMVKQKTKPDQTQQATTLESPAGRMLKNLVWHGHRSLRTHNLGAA